MTPAAVAAAIDRLMMLSAGPLDTDAEEAEVATAIDAFETVTEWRCLAIVLATRTAEKLPVGSPVTLTSFADFAALALLAEGLDFTRLQSLVDTLPPALLTDVSTSLLAMWRNACSLHALHALHDFTVPDHVPQEG